MPSGTGRTRKSLAELLKLSGENLRNEAKWADRMLADEITRMRAHDEQFRAVLDYSLAVEAEQLRRRNTL